MVNPVDPNIVSVDYTNRDYYSLRLALIDRMKERLQASGWTGNDPNDFGVALLESFAYIGDVTSYYIDRIANEMSLSTATQLSSVTNIAKTYGYTPSGYRAAVCSVTFNSVTLAAGTVIPAGTQLKGSYINGDSVVNVYYQLDEDAVMGGGGSSNTVVASHGEAIALRSSADTEGGVSGEIVGVASATSSQGQTFRLKENKVVQGSVKVFVQRGSEYEEWSEVTRLVNSGPTDAVFSISTDANNYVYVIFGDGISGRIPTPGAKIKVQYIVGGGVEGQIPANVNFSVSKIPGVLPNDVATIKAAVTIENTAATGGLEPESIETIRRLAPYSISTMDRAVTLDDYSSIMFGGSYIAKANAVADNFTSVTVYLAPYADNSKDIFPLYTTDAANYLTAWSNDTPETELNNASWNNLLVPEATRLIQNKKQIGVSVTFSPVVYVPVKVDINYSLVENYSDEQVTAEFKALLSAAFTYDKADFGQTLFPEDVENILKEAVGAKNVSVNIGLYGETTGRVPIIAEPNEILILNSEWDNTVFTPQSTEKTLSNLVVASSPSGTFKPATFDPATTNYTYKTTGSWVTITATTTDPNAHVVIKRKTYASGATTPHISLDDGVQTIKVKVIAVDGSSTTYYLKVKKI